MSIKPSIERGNPFSWRFVTPLYMGSTLNPINSSIIATALVPIALALHVAVAQVTWLVAVLYLASSVAQPTAGKLAEEFGPRRIFMAGIVMIFVAGVIGGVAHSLTWLVVSRILIGIGTSTAYPSAMLLIRRRARAAHMTEPPGSVLGALQIAALITPVVGLPIGGVLVDAWGWRTTFLVNLPFALVALGTALLWIPRDEPIERKNSARDMAARIDVVGVLGFAATLTALLIFLFSLPQPKWMFLGSGVLLGMGLVGWELRVSRAFLDVRLLTVNRALTRTFARFGLLTFCVYTVLYGVTEWIGAARGMSSLATGLLLLPMSGLSAIVVGPVSKRNWIRGPLIVSAIASIIASMGVLWLTRNTSVAWIVVITLLFGVTMGTMASGNQTALYTQVSSDYIGTASGLFRTFGYLGSIASSALISIVFHRGVSDAGLHHLAAIMIVASLGALIITVADRQLGSRAIEHSAAP